MREHRFFLTRNFHIRTESTRFYTILSLYGNVLSAKTGILAYFTKYETLTFVLEFFTSTIIIKTVKPSLRKFPFEIPHVLQKAEQN